MEFDLAAAIEQVTMTQMRNGRHSRSFPSPDRRMSKCRLNSAQRNFSRLRKGASNPEAVIKLFNMHLEKNWGETAEFDKYYAPPEAESVWQLSPVQPAPPKKNVEAFRADRCGT